MIHALGLIALHFLFVGLTASASFRLIAYTYLSDMVFVSI